MKQQFKNIHYICSTFIIPITMGIWVCWVLLCLIVSTNHNIMSRIIFGSEMILDIALVFFSFKVYNALYNTLSKKLIFILVISYLGVWLTDVVFYVVFTLLNTSSTSNFYHSLYLVPFCVYVVFQMLFWIRLVSKFIIVENTVWIAIVFVLINVIYIFLFIIESQWKVTILSYLGITQIVTCSLELIIFNCATLALICSIHRYLAILAVGTIITIASDLWEKFLFLNQIMGLLHYSQFFWVLGITLSVIGLALMLYEEQSMNIQLSLRSTSGIKSQITLSIFIFCMLSFVIIFLLCYSVSLISNVAIVNFLFIVVVYSVIIVILANYIGIQFEEPFNQIANNITALTADTKEIINKNDMNKINNYDYGISEFNQLHKFFISQLEINNKNVESQKKLNQHVMRSIHDIRSPLTVLDNLLSNAETCLPENEIIKFKQQIVSIRNIANKLLDNNRRITHNVSSEESYHVLTSGLKMLVENKRLEWNKDIIHLDMPSEIIWLKYTESDFQNTLSNILNNAHDAIKNQPKGLIKFTVIVESHQIKLIILDNGCGIPSDELENIKTGKSLKINGNGIGLPSAIEYMKLINGKLEIESKETVGTNVILTIPYSSTPIWGVTGIKLYNRSIIVVDNDPEILLFWQKKFLLKTTNVKHFSTSHMFLEWCTQEPNLNNFIILMDYELGENHVCGLDLLVKNNIQNAIIVTDYAEHAWLQKQMSNTNYYLLPKVALDLINITIE